MIKDDIKRLVGKPAAEVRLDPPDMPQAIRARTGLERRQAGDVDSEEMTVVSTDGLFTFTVRVVKT